VKKRFEWSPQARSDLKEIGREQAMQILMALTRYSETGEGDIKHLRGKLTGTRRLRVGDWRVRLQEKKGDILYILAVSHRSEAYR
jgi:mRNA-degrading endonuclease RelE of RelBE toxin-antitoxin system